MARAVARFDSPGRSFPFLKEEVKLTMRMIPTIGFPVVLLGFMLMPSGTVIAQAIGRPLFSKIEVAAPERLPEAAKANGAVSGDVDADVLTAPAIDVPLPEGRTAVARLSRIARDRDGALTWIGEFEDAPGSVLVITRVAGVLAGFATYGHATLELRLARGGTYLFYEVDPARLPPRDGFTKVVQPTADTLQTSDAYGVNGAASVDTTSLVVQDLLVVYTAKAANRWGRATLEGMIHNAVQSANQAYQNSKVGIDLNMVALNQVSIVESANGMQSTLDSLAHDSTVRSLRDNYAADVVVLVSEDSNYCGWASLTWGNGNTDAYAVVGSSCLSNQSLAHEVGHLQGLDHNREDGGNGGFYPYGYGYRVCASDGFRDVMSYACPTIGVPRILQFSNPTVYYNGYATGIDYEASPSTAADAARALVNSAATVADYRVASTVTSVPNAPTGLASTTVKFDRVILAWSDNSWNEAGFKIQRSTDGVNYSLIATLAADARGYSDFSVAPKRTYYYRVRAYNSAGGSAFSNVVKVWTPDAPPATPTGIAAANGGNGTATITWVDKSTNETSFEIRRRKYYPATATWSAATTVGTVGANVTRFMNTSGNGTFRYYVRARNTSGTSSSAGPAQVTVTGG